MPKLIALSSGHHAMVDKEDFDWLNQYSWHVHNGYAARAIGPRGRQKRVGMHNDIMGLTTTREVDHIDRNPLNNQKHNLRLVSGSLQGYHRLMKTRSLPRGVYSSGNKFEATIRYDHQKIYLGLFDTPEEAQQAYLAKAFELYGEHPPQH